MKFDLVLGITVNFAVTEHNIFFLYLSYYSEDGEKSDLKTNENKVPKLFSGFGIKRLLHKPLNSDNSRQGQDKQQLYDTENESYNNPNEPREFLILRNLKFYKQLVSLWSKFVFFFLKIS